MKVTIREETEADKATLDEFEADLGGSEYHWRVPEFRKSLKDSYVFTIEADGEIAGEIVLEYPARGRSGYSVGFRVGRRFWNQGICTEALKQIARFAFDELNLHKLFGDNDADNPASGRVFEKAGFTKEGVLKDQVFRDGEYIDVTMWGLINPAPEDHSSKE